MGNRFDELLAIESTLSNFTLDDITLLYFSRKLEEADLYFLTLAFLYGSKDDKGLPQAFMKDPKIAEALPFKERKYNRALIRLEAIGLIVVNRVHKQTFYKVSTDGIAILKLKMKNNSSFYNSKIRDPVTKLLKIGGIINNED